ncbi:hypothetical protein TrLO_g11357 [Triparma laevis f. longispina]|uniref:Uncharacterized protein n=1 Tax=Triparma laevis f. longispina TaxID=1714387 RepID=A0A9W7C6T6_9STRA|nr:hypothetical protein TrLO_g11357 [Triparma laevis f. longispina]
MERNEEIQTLPETAEKEKKAQDQEILTLKTEIAELKQQQQNAVSLPPVPKVMSPAQRRSIKRNLSEKAKGEE